MAATLSRIGFRITLVLTVFVLALTGGSPAAAAPIACSETALRSAINGASTGNTITLPASCTITLTGAADEDLNGSGDLDINENTTATALAIEGAGTGSTIIDGGGVDRVLHIRGGRTVTLRDLTLRNGDVVPSASQGGAIYFGPGTLTLERVIVRSSRATIGGGIYHLSGTLALTDVAIVGNTAVSGGGLAVAGTATLTNVTVSANTAAQSGGGIGVVGSLTLNNVTITDNTASQGGGLSAQLGTADVTNTIMAGNISGSDADCLGTLRNVGNVIVGTAGCTISGIGTLTTADPLLLALANNGGATLTHALRPTSPAIGAGNDATCATADQRRVARVGACDIGAFEAQGTPLLLSANDVSYRGGDTLSLGVVVQNPAGVPVTVDAYLAFLLPAGSLPGCPAAPAAFVTGAGALVLVCGATASPATFPKLAAGVAISAGFVGTATVFTATAPSVAAPLSAVLALTPAGALADGSVDPGDIAASSSVTFELHP